MKYQDIFRHIRADSGRVRRWAAVTAGLLAVLFCLTALVRCSARRPALVPHLQPLQETADQAGSAASRDATARVTLFSSCRLSLRQLEGAVWERYLKEVVGQAGDPFASPGEDLPRPYLIFLLTVENGLEEPLVLSPGFSSISGKKGQSRNTAFDLRTLEEVMAVNPSFTPSLARRIHESTITVDPGKRHAKLIVFPALSRKIGEVAVVIPSVNAGTKAVDVSFPFQIQWK